MNKILTLTLNPALDIATAVERLLPGHKLRCGSPRVDPGGGGINVARVAMRLGTRALALYAAGGPSGGELQRLLDAEHVAAQCVPIQGSTRESFTVREAASGQEFRFVLPGPSLEDKEWMGCLERCWVLAEQARLVVASGSLPPGVPQDVYARLASGMRGPARLVLDASGPALQAALQVGVFAVKPSLSELRELTGEALEGLPQQLQACRGLVAAGRAAMVALSLGNQGALLVTAQGAWRAPGLPVTVAGTVGAGDSFVAGLVVALARDASAQEALRHAMAASAVAVQAAGTAQCDPQQFAAMLQQVQIEVV